MASDCLRFVAAIFLAVRSSGAAFFVLFLEKGVLKAYRSQDHDVPIQILVIPW